MFALNYLAGLLIQLAIGLAAASITVVACALYARHKRSASSLVLLCAAAGYLLVGVASCVVFYFILSQPGSGSVILLRVNTGLSWAAPVFSLLFSISLLVVLRDIVRLEPPTEQAHQPGA